MIHIFGEYYADADSNCVTLERETGRKDKKGNPTYSIEGYYTNLAEAVTVGFIDKFERDLIKDGTPDTESREIVSIMKSVRDQITKELLKPEPFSEGEIKLTSHENKKRIAKFYKVSKERFVSDYIEKFAPYDSEFYRKQAMEVYGKIKLPKRATAGSAGYDFFSPIDITLKPGQTINIPTGIRVEMNRDWVLQCYPRSGLGFKYRLQLNNTVGIIDSDYFYSDNEGHIFAKITNDTNEGETVHVEAGKGFMQGIFVQYGITVDDDTKAVRNGGMGSTGA